MFVLIRVHPETLHTDTLSAFEGASTRLTPERLRGPRPSRPGSAEYQISSSGHRDDLQTRIHSHTPIYEIQIAKEGPAPNGRVAGASFSAPQLGFHVCRLPWMLAAKDLWREVTYSVFHPVFSRTA